MPSKQAEPCIPDRWPCHSVRASPPWTTCSQRRGCSSAGTHVGPIWQSCCMYVLSKLPLLWRLHVASRNPRGAGSWMNSEEASQSRSWNTWALWWPRIVYETAKKLPPNSEELKESYDIFNGGGEQHSSWFDTQMGPERHVNGVRQRLDHDN